MLEIEAAAPQFLSRVCKRLSAKEAETKADAAEVAEVAEVPEVVSAKVTLCLKGAKVGVDQLPPGSEAEAKFKHDFCADVARAVGIGG